jgi:Calcium-activated chloride channel
MSKYNPYHQENVLNAMEVVPLTPGRGNRRQEHEKKKTPRTSSSTSGWSSSMALFSSNFASSQTPPPPNLSESSRRPTDSDSKQRRPLESRMFDTTFHETSIDRTASGMRANPIHIYTSESHEYHRPPSLQNSTRPSRYTESPRQSTEHSTYTTSIPSPWLPPIESLTTPSSVASSGAASFVFGSQRRPSLRSEISRQDSVTSASSQTTPTNYHRNPWKQNQLQSILGAESSDNDEDMSQGDEYVLPEYDGSFHDIEEGDETIEVTLPKYFTELPLPEEEDVIECRLSSEDSRLCRKEKVQSWTHQASQELFRVGELAATELRNFTRVAISTTNHRLMHPSSNLSPIREPLRDLTGLKKMHKDKMLQLQALDNQEYFDFALVLTPQPVYSFWAERLDFRSEHLNDSLLSAQSSDTEEFQDDADDDGFSNKENEGLKRTPSLVDSRPPETPQTGMRRRRKNLMSPEEMRTPTSQCPERQTSERRLHWSSGIDDSNKQMRKPRLSVFDKALGSFTPSNSRISFGGYSTTRYVGEETPSSIQGRDASAIPSTSRRRWGNRPDPSMSSLRSSNHLSTARLSAGSEGIEIELEEETVCKRRKLMADEDEGIPSQKIPRGILARSNGMIQFQSALKRGIVVRRHRPSQEAVFVKLFSMDGGDTIKFEPVSYSEAMMAFREQRVRYNRKLAKRGIQVQSQRWAHVDEETDVEAQHFEMPDFIAAEQYRRKQLEKKKSVALAMIDTATKLKNSGTVKLSDVVAVHPGRHQDPRTKGELGTAQLRRSRSEFDPQYTFSVIQKSNRVTTGSSKNKYSVVIGSERWHSGEGGTSQFRTLDLEAASEGEYWMIFRGFLLLHRDAASGRYASHRMAGFGCNYREELEEADHNRLQADAFHEPRNISWVERRIAKFRDIDLTLQLEGYAEPGAIPPPPDYFLGFKSPGTQIWSRLRQAGLDTTRIYSIDPRIVMIKVRCPVDRMSDVAEVLRIKLKTREGKYAPFRESNLGLFCSLNDDLDAPGGDPFFRSFQRQKVIDFIIRSRIRDSGAQLGQNTDLGKMIQVQVPLHMHRKLQSLYHVWFNFSRRENWTNRDGRSMSVGPTDPLGLDLDLDQKPLDLSHPRKIPNFLSRLFVGAFYQPLDSIEQYFGEQVTFYFAWIQHCSHHLVFLSVVGFIVAICQYNSQTWDHPIRPYFAVVIMIWSFNVLVKWRQRSNFLADRWGTMNYKEQETTRPQFKGEYRRDEITGEWVIYYPPWKRYVKYAISFPITLAFTASTLILILMVHANRDLMLAKYFDPDEKFELSFTISAIGETKPIHAVELNRKNMRDPKFWFVVAGLPSLLGLFLPLLNFILMRISILLNDFENYRTESHYRTALIVKVFSFRFVCYFATLYYYSFLSIGDAQMVENGILRVGTGVLIYTTIAHYWGLFLQMNFPLLIYRIRRSRQKKRLHKELMQVEEEEAALEQLCESDEDSEEIQKKRIHLINRRLLLDQAQDALWQEVMLPMHDSFPEYIQAVVQFAFVTCFSVVLPITPMICLMNHLISMRLDAYKLCKTRKRPLAQTTGGIGVWEHVLHIVSVIAILTNCWLMGFTNAQIYSIVDNVGGDLAQFGIIVGWEHVMLLIKYVMQTSASKLPKSVRDKITKEQYEQERKRHSSMRQKKDRQSFRHDASFQSSAEKSIASPPAKHCKNTEKKGEKGILAGGSRTKSALMTIPSEELSELSPSHSNIQDPKIGLGNEKAHKKMPITPTAKVSESKSTLKNYVDIKGAPIPSPMYLGSSLDAEAAQDTSILHPTRIFDPSSHPIGNERSSLDTLEDESYTASSVSTFPSEFPRTHHTKVNNGTREEMNFSTNKVESPRLGATPRYYAS